MAETAAETEELRALYHKARKELARLFAQEHERGMEISRQAHRLSVATGRDVSAIVDPALRLNAAVDFALERLKGSE